MDDKKLMDQIRESAEKADIPESLKPEEILRKIKEVEAAEPLKKELEVPEKNVEKKIKKQVSFYRYGSWAAVAAIVLLGVSIGGPAFTKTKRVEKTENLVVESENMMSMVQEDKTEGIEEPVHEDMLAEKMEESAAEEESRDKQADKEISSEKISEPEMEVLEMAESKVNEAVKDEWMMGTDIVMPDEADEFEITVEECAEIEDVDQVTAAPMIHFADYKEIYRILKEYEEKEPYLEYYYETPEGIVIEDAIEEESIAVSDSVEEIEAPEAEMKISSTYSTGKGAAISDSYSVTNVREVGIEEADCVKTDGKYIYAMDSSGMVRIIDVEKKEMISAISSTEDERTAELYLEGDQLQIITQTENYVTYKSMKAASNRAYSQIKSQTRVYTYDLSDRVNPTLQDIYVQDGHYRTSRKKDGRLYLFTAYRPQYELDEDLEESYIPKTGNQLLSCEQIYYLPYGEEEFQYDGNDFLVASSIKDTDTAKAEDQICIINGSGLFYVSQNNVYVASTSWNDYQTKTELLRFGYKDGVFTEGASAVVPGWVKDSFCMDEYDDMLRMVTTVDGYFQGIPYLTESGNRLQNNQLLVLDMDLTKVGEISGVARNEEIKSARFMGDIGYFVTYENTDPLFSADLSDPYHPVLLGELEVTGFSEYLHPYGEGMLLGIGWETDPESGRFEGLKCSMFDTSDPSEVKETDRLVIGDAEFSEVMNDYKAILIDPKKNIFGFAYGGYGESYDTHYFYGVFSYEKENGFEPEAYLKIPQQDDESWNSWYGYRNTRGIYIGTDFYLVNDYGVFVYDMENDFSRTADIIW